MMFSDRKIEYDAAFIFGLLGTMPILSIAGLTTFTWLLLIMVALYFIKDFNSSARLEKFIIPDTALVLLGIVTTVIGLDRSMPDYWKNQQGKQLLWSILYLVVIIYYSNRNKSYLAKAYIRGVYSASIIQMVWCFMQYILFTIAGVKLNDAVFVDIFHLSEDTLSQMKNGNIALTGLCWNTGNMAPLLLFGFVMSRSLPLKVAFALCTLLSGSRSAVLGLAVYVGVSCILKQRKAEVNKRIVLTLIGAAAVCIPVMVLLFRSTSVLDVIEKTISSFSKDTLTSESSAKLHTRYLTSVLDIGRFAGPLNTLFGFGLGSSGYPFAVLYDQYNTVKDGAWVVECDIINQLWGAGLIALLVRYAWYITYALKAFKIDRKTFCFFVAFFAEGLTYNVTFNWAFIMLVCMFIMIQNNEPVSAMLREPVITDYYKRVEGFRVIEI